LDLIFINKTVFTSSKQNYFHGKLITIFKPEVMIITGTLQKQNILRT